jgi:chaperonin cofactor prefoldin
MKMNEELEEKLEPLQAEVGGLFFDMHSVGRNLAELRKRIEQLEEKVAQLAPRHG